MRGSDQSRMSSNPPALKTHTQEEPPSHHSYLHLQLCISDPRRFRATLIAKLLQDLVEILHILKLPFGPLMLWRIRVPTYDILNSAQRIPNYVRRVRWPQEQQRQPRERRSSHRRGTRRRPVILGKYCQLSRRREHNHGNVNIAQHGKLIRLLHQPIPPLRIGHLPIRGILNLLYFELHSPHDCRTNEPTND